MRTPRSTEEALERLRAIRAQPDPADRTALLAPFLAHRSNHVIAKAADIIAEHAMQDQGPALVDAFRALLPVAPQRDPGCTALLALLKALIALEYPAAEVFSAGLRHVQWEGSFGPPVDVGAPVRGLSIQALAQIRHPDAHYEAVSLLADAQVPARVGAVRALAITGTSEGELLLRLKALQGDHEDVLGECFTALMRIAPQRSLLFVAKFLESANPAMVEPAALALGESRLPAALEPLRQAYERARLPAVRRTLLVSIGLLRQETAVEYLLTQLPERTEEVMDALALYRRDEQVRERVEAVLGRPWRE